MIQWCCTVLNFGVCDVFSNLFCEYFWLRNSWLYFCWWTEVSLILKGHKSPVLLAEKPSGTIVQVLLMDRVAALSDHVVNTLQGTNISPWKGIFEDDFPFPQVGYVNSLEGIPLQVPKCFGTLPASQHPIARWKRESIHLQSSSCSPREVILTWQNHIKTMGKEDNVYCIIYINAYTHGKYVYIYTYTY